MTPAIGPSPASATALVAQFSQRDRRVLLRVATRYLGCDHLAHDALQESLLALSQQIEPPDRPVAWLHRALVHRCRHLRRSLRRRQHHEHCASQRCSEHFDCDNPLHHAVAHEVGRRLDAARKALPQEQLEVLERFETSGQDYRAIAAALCIPIGTVRSRLSRARRALSEALGADPAA